MASLVEAEIRSIFSSFPFLGVSLFVLALLFHTGVHMLCKHRTAKLHPRLWSPCFLMCAVYSYSEFRSLPKTPNSFLFARNQTGENGLQIFKYKSFKNTEPATHTLHVDYLGLLCNPKLGPLIASILLSSLPRSVSSALPILP